MTYSPSAASAATAAVGFIYDTFGGACVTNGVDGFVSCLPPSPLRGQCEALSFTAFSVSMLGDLLPASLSVRLAMLGSEIMMRLGESYSCLDPSKAHLGSPYANSTLTMKTLAATTASHLKQPTKVLEKTIKPADPKFVPADLLDAGGISLTGELSAAAELAKGEFDSLKMFVTENCENVGSSYGNALQKMREAFENLNQIDLNAVIAGLQKSISDEVIEAATVKLAEATATATATAAAAADAATDAATAAASNAAAAQATAKGALDNLLKERADIQALVGYLEETVKPLLRQIGQPFINKYGAMNEFSNYLTSLQKKFLERLDWEELSGAISGATKFAKSQGFPSEEVAAAGLTAREAAEEIAKSAGFIPSLNRYIDEIVELSEPAGKLADEFDTIWQQINFGAMQATAKFVDRQTPSLKNIGNAFESLTDSLVKLDELKASFVTPFQAKTKQFAASLRNSLMTTYDKFHKNVVNKLVSKEVPNQAAESVATSPKVIQPGLASKTTSWAFTALGIGANLAQQRNVNQQRELAHPKPKTNRKG